MYLTVFVIDAGDNVEDDDQVNDTIAIRYFSDLSLAHLYSNYLNECNISNYLTNTFMNQMIPGLEQIELHIRKSDHLKALNCLANFETQYVEFDSKLDQTKSEKRFSNRIKPWIIAFIFITILILLYHLLLKNLI